MKKRTTLSKGGKEGNDRTRSPAGVPAKMYAIGEHKGIKGGSCRAKIGRPYPCYGSWEPFWWSLNERLKTGQSPLSTRRQDGEEADWRGEPQTGTFVLKRSFVEHRVLQPDRGGQGCKRDPLGKVEEKVENFG